MRTLTMIASVTLILIAGLDKPLPGTNQGGKNSPPGAPAPAKPAPPPPPVRG